MIRNGWADDLYRDPEGDSYAIGRFGNHPAVYVSWFDAVAFCRWLSRRLGFTVRLPFEWEWQQAATGGDDRNVFPWGGDWDPKQEPYRANTFESRLGQATAVGMYPAGASPTGALDMAGTVWEWCVNKFDTPKVEETRSGAEDFDYRAARRVLEQRSGQRALGQPQQEQPEQPEQQHRLPCGVFVARLSVSSRAGRLRRPGKCMGFATRAPARDLLPHIGNAHAKHRLCRKPACAAGSHRKT